MDATRKAKRNIPADGDGWSNDELFSHAFDRLRALRKEMEKRRNRDAAGTALTDAFLSIQALGHRLAKVGPEFDRRAPAPAEEEDERRSTVPLAELMASATTHEEELVAIELGVPVSDLRVKYFRDTLEFLVSGCRQAQDITHKVIAFARRVRPEYLKHFGLSQADVGRKLGQKRATVSAREKRLVEAPLKANGTKGYKLLGGQKSATHAERCRAAQMGNTNRRDGEARKNGEHNSTQPPTTKK